MAPVLASKTDSTSLNHDQRGMIEIGIVAMSPVDVGGKARSASWCN